MYVSLTSTDQNSPVSTKWQPAGAPGEWHLFVNIGGDLLVALTPAEVGELTHALLAAIETTPVPADHATA
jgi:hypothetical protein